MQIETYCAYKKTRHHVLYPCWSGTYFYYAVQSERHLRKMIKLISLLTFATNNIIWCKIKFHTLKSQNMTYLLHERCPISELIYHHTSWMTYLCAQWPQHSQPKYSMLPILEAQMCMSNVIWHKLAFTSRSSVENVADQKQMTWERHGVRPLWQD